MILAASGILGGHGRNEPSEGMGAPRATLGHGPVRNEKKRSLWNVTSGGPRTDLVPSGEHPFGTWVSSGIDGNRGTGCKHILPWPSGVHMNQGNPVLPRLAQVRNDLESSRLGPKDALAQAQSNGIE